MYIYVYTCLDLHFVYRKVSLVNKSLVHLTIMNHEKKNAQ